MFLLAREIPGDLVMIAVACNLVAAVNDPRTPARVLVFMVVPKGTNGTVAAV